MPTSTDSAQVSKSGIRQLSNGQSVIPSSTRADGSVRKEIRVKPGYKPPEDVEVYKNRAAETWKNRGKGGVPGAESTEENQPSLKAAAAAAKNAKRREARKKAAAAGKEEGVEEGAAADEAKAVHSVPQAAESKPAEVVDPEEQKAKEARKLAKKLRQARELKDKKDKGDSLLPEQFEKVIKMNELIRQLDKLGFDAEGEKKATQGNEAKENTKPED